MFTLNPYLNFGDRTEEAFNFYKSVFGGEFSALQRFKDVPQEAQGMLSEKEGNKIMHMALPIGKGTILMGSDSPESMGNVMPGNNISLSLHPDNEEEARRLFNALSAGGKVTMPFDKTFWRAYFGMCTDKFGINWMVNYQISE